MRFLALVSVLALTLSCSVAAISDEKSVSRFNLDTEARQTKRSLRWLNVEEEDAEEERGIEKADDVIEKIVHTSPKLPAGLSASALEKVDDITTAAKKAAFEYPKGLSSTTLKQLEKIEDLRSKDIVKYSKQTADGMRREIDPFPGIKVAPVLTSHVGRDQQRFGKDGSRLLSCIVVSRPAEQGGGDVLLISSSNPTKNDWLLPKGGWDEGESIQKAAWRELMEEGGVNGQLTAGLGRLGFKNDNGKKLRYYAYKMRANTVYDQWAESVRYRLWVSYEDAIKMLAGRKEMVNIVKRAQLTDELAKAGRLPKEDPALAKLKFEP